MVRREGLASVQRCLAMVGQDGAVMGAYVAEGGSIRIRGERIWRGCRRWRGVFKRVVVGGACREIGFVYVSPN